MSRPQVSAYTEALYARLPQAYRDADERAGAGTGDDYPLLRYCSLLGDQVQRVRELTELLAAGGLSDPALAEEAWLVRIAQMAGIDPTPYRDAEQLRVAIEGANLARNAGSAAAVLAAVRPALSETRTARITGRDAATFTYRVRVYEREVPDRAEVQRVLEATRPAGLRVELDVAPGQTWGQLAQRNLTLGQVRTLTAAQVRTAVPGEPIIYGGPL